MDLVPIRQAERLQKPVPLSELVDRANASAKGCHDYANVRLRQTTMRIDGTWMFQQEGRFSRHALAQICARLDLPGGGTVPASYVARCPAPLAASNLNHWIRHSAREDQEVLVRTRDLKGSKRPMIRAVLSDRYAVLDHVPVLQSLCEAAPRHNLSVQNWSLDDEQMTVRLLVNEDHPASLKDPLRIGLHISNSEVGLGRITVTALLTRLVCTNGLVVHAADLGGFSRRHIGRASESLEWIANEGLPKVLLEADEAAKRFVKLREIPAPTPIDEYLRTVTQQAELPASVLPKATARLEGETMYDVVNAFTSLAQTYSVSERVRIETVMSRFLSDTRNLN